MAVEKVDDSRVDDQLVFELQDAMTLVVENQELDRDTHAVSAMKAMRRPWEDKRGPKAQRTIRKRWIERLMDGIQCLDG